MNDKLKRLASKMVDLFPSEFSSPQDCYDLFQNIYKKQFDYFSYFEPENLIKLVFYLYSYKTTKDFIERLNNYIGSTGKRYKSHYHTILNWYRKDGDNKEQKGDDLGTKYKGARHTS